jgi:arginine decarboxylase-like protein
VTDHDNALMSEVATKQDLYNVGVLIDSNFKSLAGDIHNLRTDMDAQFVRVDSQFVAVRSEMTTGFAEVAGEFVAVRSEMHSLLTTFKDEINKTTMRTGFATFLAIAALLSIDRWWS